MRRRVILMPMVASLMLAGAGFIGYGAGTRDGARLLDQVVARLHRESIDSLSLDDIYERAARGLVKTIDDPYAALFSPQEMSRFQRESLGNSYGGVGLLIEDQEGTIVVSKVFPNTPGEQGGILSGDRIVAVDGQSTKGLKLDQVSRRMLGTPGTEVRLTVMRDGVAAAIENRLTRAVVHVPSVPYAMLLEGDVGYLPLQRFNDVASEELGRAVEKLRAQGAKGLVLDLRGNPGGDLDESIRVANLFLPSGSEVVTVKYRSRPTEVRKAGGEPVAGDLPLVVLTDSTTASASEIVAGALQDHDRAILLGTTSFGKGVVQTLYPLDGGWYLKLTNAKWYTPSGRLIQRERGRGDSLPAADTTRPVFRSDRGRTVYGGGGIVPDVAVGSDTLSAAEQALQKALIAKPREVNAALTQLAKEVKPTVRPDFAVQPAWRDSVYRRWTRAGVTVTRAQFDAGRPLVDRLIEQRVSRTVYGDSAAFRRWVPEDAQLRRALELLGSAASTEQLLRVAAR
ncbi:MAG: S41 family peptidase [Gemmatimonadales bacterium]|nr:S41 family peptidase [Gemmatimonadales bacterium]